MSESDETSMQVIDGETGEVIPTPRRIDLSNLRDVRLEMAHVYREMDAGRIKTQDATRRVYVLDAIGKVITVAELEKRLAELEERPIPGQPLQQPAMRH
jgi:hypothetical protein